MRWPEEDIGRSSVNPCTTPSTNACQSVTTPATSPTPRAASSAAEMRAAAAVRRRPRRRTPVSYARSVSRNDVILGIAAGVLVGFALVVSLVLPRRNPNFPGTHLGALLLVAALLIVAMLTAVAVLGESHHFVAEGEGAVTEAQPTPTETTTPTTPTTPSTPSAPTETGGGGPSGDAAAGKEIFATGAQPP